MSTSSQYDSIAPGLLQRQDGKVGHPAPPVLPLVAAAPWRLARAERDDLRVAP
ncbi:MAG: hypothetical protein HC828_05350, partial [Blastochloris sp.]|nr:hypothetical protein [Blastochloris sp.]